MTTFIGRLHLLLLHLPIGILLLSAALAIWSKWKNTTLYRQAIEQTVRFGAFTAVIAAGCGWLLAAQGDYDSDTLEWHRWTGILAAIMAVATWWIQYTKWYFWGIYATNIAIIVAGHFGGTVTHGDNFLFPTTPSTPRAVQGNDPAFEAVILPIFQEKCISCHNPNKKKGGLLLDSWEHLIAGGAHGAVLVLGSSDSSEIYKRLILSPHDEHRMPPKGKTQLTPEEIAIVARWIDAGAAPNLPASAILPDKSAQEFPDVKVAPLSPAIVQQLRQDLIPVMTLGKDLPWISISLAGKQDLSAGLLKKLEQAADQIVHLDAGHSNMSDELLEYIKPLKHLTRLQLSGTKVTDAGLKTLGKLAHLNYLNLTGTAASDGIAAILSQFPALQSLYLADAKVSAATLAQMHSQYPSMNIFSGAPADSTQKRLQLLAPKMLFSRTVFDDTVQVKLEFPFKNVSLYYTLDQASPTSRSFAYNGSSIVLSESGTVKAIAIKDGWEPSPIVTASFAKRKYKPVDVKIGSPPSPKYPGKGASTLADNILGNDANDGSFLGYQGEHLTAVLDFGQNIAVSTIGVHYLENNAPWIFAPRGIKVWASADGQKWTDCAQTVLPVNTSLQPAQTAIASARPPKPVHTRYLKVKVENLMKLPPWHPSAGDKPWIFVDEILVE